MEKSVKTNEENVEEVVEEIEKENVDKNLVKEPCPLASLDAVRELEELRELYNKNSGVKKYIDSVKNKNIKKQEKKEKQIKIKTKTPEIIPDSQKRFIINNILDNDDGSITSFTKLYQKIKNQYSGKMLIPRNDCKIYFNEYKTNKLLNKSKIPNNFNETIKSVIHEGMTEKLNTFEENLLSKFNSKFEELNKLSKKQVRIKEKPVADAKVVENIVENVVADAKPIEKVIEVQQPKPYHQFRFRKINF